ncbi:MAG TPA: PP2C family protein-serine/threonine phosphatase [Thermoanaerobaculia bacterium]|nr:PP2C family protein-serine/threonine phosphatase [Thermoanaerobaculia bacterium]
MIATFQHDLPALIVGVALCTIAAGLLAFALFGRRISNIDLPLAGAFAALYGIRLILRTQSIAMMLGDSLWLRESLSALDYIVPIPAAALFERLFGQRLRWVNRAAVIAFAAYAFVAIPYELAAKRPDALRTPQNALIIGFIVLFLVNVVFAKSNASGDVRLLRIASGVFALYVLNAHFEWVDAPFGLSSEPVGFLIFIAAIVFTLVRHTVRNEMRVAAVDGELAAARQIQLSILPKSPPSIRGLEVEALYAPASEVAGDFYDFAAIDGDRVGILIADVSGHGVPAALVASMLKVALAGHADLAAQPARLLEEFNRFFCGKLERQFITASYAVIDAKSGAVTLASAGHPPPFVVRGDRSIEEIAADGVVLGRFSQAVFREASTHLSSDDAIVLYTDGVPEALNAKSEMWGDDRFREAVANGASIQRVLDAVKSWSGTLSDDVTLVVARRV